MNKVLGLILASAVVMGVSASQPARAAGSGVCVTARVDAPFLLPDGHLYPAGPLTLCDGGAYSPVDNFQRISVSGSTIGLFVSSRRIAEIRSLQSPQILFSRASDGTLTLVGYTLPALGESVAFRLKRGAEVASARWRTADGGTSSTPPASMVAATAR